jgi:sterol desaturase/sphingolipid hydroxylase (fatty acid hydroxylase superfamily)
MDFSHSFIFFHHRLFSSIKPVSLAPPSAKNRSTSWSSILLYAVAWNAFPVGFYCLVDAFFGTHTISGPVSVQEWSLIRDHWLLHSICFFDIPQDISALGLLYDVVRLVLLWDLIFYWVHVVLHTRTLQRLVHYTHHIHTFAFHMVIYYVDVVDGLVNFAAIVMPCVVLSTHPLSMMAYYVFTGFLGACSHSGYDVAFGSSRYHYIHHLKHNVNYGAVGVQDIMWGSYMSMDEAVATTSAYWKGFKPSEWVMTRPYLVRGRSHRHVRSWVLHGSFDMMRWFFWIIGMGSGLWQFPFERESDNIIRCNDMMKGFERWGIF